MFNKFPKRTGIYHIKDGIENLELKITFRHINSLLKLPKFDYNKNISTDWHESVQEREFDHEISHETEIIEVCLKWQEKLFSEAEEELFKESKNCTTEIQKKYHQWLLQETKGSSRRRRKKREKKILKSPKEELISSRPAQKIHTYVNEDNFKPAERPIGRVGMVTSKTDSIVEMYIYATIDVETQLVHLQWHSKEHMMHIYPDFNSFNQNPYYIEIDKDYRHLYAYGVENISKARTTTPYGDLSLFLDLPEIKPHWRTEEERAGHFMMPPKRTRRVSLLFELREAFNFDRDNIHIRYLINLPPNIIHEEGLLVASTHSSSMNDSGVYHFGYNWQLTLLCEEGYDAADMLHIYFEVISIDSWERERMEGYSFFAVNLLKASKTVEHRLQCVRPVDSFRTALERFFIGGRRKFNFVKYYGRKSAHENGNANADNTAFHCRYGCRMKSTGFLKFSCQSFIQRNCELLEPCKSRKSGMTLDDIMQAYREARKRLEELSLK